MYMNKKILLGGLLLAAGSLLVSAGPKDEVQGAIKKLADTGNYAWKTTVENAGGGFGGGGGGGQFRVGPTLGKVDSSGFIHLTMTRGDRETEAVIKGDKGAIKTDQGWTSLSEMAQAGGGGGRNPGRMMARGLQDYQAPAAQAEEILAKTKNIQKSGDAYVGELTEEGAAELIPFGRRIGNAPAPRNAKGNVKFWVKDGVLTQYEYNVQGAMSFNNNDININRTTTVEIKDAGSTKVTVPEEAKKKFTI
jgi:hypothetical protein